MAKLRVYLHITDGGDGSVGVEPANSMEEARAALEAEMNYFGQAYWDGGATYVDIELNDDGTYSCPPPSSLELKDEE